LRLKPNRWDSIDRNIYLEPENAEGDQKMRAGGAERGMASFIGHKRPQSLFTSFGMKEGCVQASATNALLAFNV